MLKLLTVFLTLFYLLPCISADCQSHYEIETESNDYWQGKIVILVPEDVNGWTVHIEFDNNVDSIDCALANASGSGRQWTLSSRDFDSEISAGTSLEVGIIVHFSGDTPFIIRIEFNNNSVCEEEGLTTTTSGQDDCANNYIVDTQNTNQWQGRVIMTIPQDIDGWTLKIHFNTVVDNVECALATVTGSGSLWTLTSRGWDDELQAGMTLEIGLIVHYSDSATLPYINNMILNDILICSTGSAPTTDPTRPTTSSTTPSTTSASTTQPTTPSTTSSTTTHTIYDECPRLDVYHEWGNGFDARITFTIDHDTDNSWTVYFGFDGKLDQFNVYQGSVSTSDWMNFEVDNLAWDGDLTVGDKFTLEMQGLFGNGRPNMITARIDNQDICS